MKIRVLFNPETNNLIVFIGCEKHERMIVIEQGNPVYEQFLTLI